MLRKYEIINKRVAFLSTHNDVDYFDENAAWMTADIPSIFSTNFLLHYSYIKIFSPRRSIDVSSAAAKIRNLKCYHAEQTFNDLKSNNGDSSLWLHGIKY